MRYAQILNGAVVNVISAEDPSAVALPGELVPVDDHLEGRWGIGWKWDGEKPTPPIPNPLIFVEGNPSADGLTPAVAHVTWPEHPALTPPDEVVFVLNGTASAPIPVTERSAALEFFASGPGPIDVVAEGQTIRVEATP